VRLANLLQEKEQVAVEKVKRKRAELFDKLRELRLKLAQEINKPAFVVFSDASLEDMENKKPRTREEFAEVSGVGEAKLEKYADAFLKVINRHLDTLENDLPTPRAQL